MTKFSSLARARVIGPEGGSWGGGAGEGAAGVDVLMVSSSHWTLNSCFGGSRSIWVHLAMFRYYTKVGAKQVELVQLIQKFVP